jgi:NAD(P)-dependent dehydrogenase (short-subunit alcohol dehydrogenase family)
VLSTVLPETIKRKRGAIVNIASIAVFHVTVPHVPYAASKAEVVALTRDLAQEVGRFRIRANAIAPGPIEAQVRLAEHDELVESFATDRSDEPLNVAVVQSCRMQMMRLMRLEFGFGLLIRFIRFATSHSVS